MEKERAKGEMISKDDEKREMTDAGKERRKGKKKRSRANTVCEETENVDKENYSKNPDHKRKLVRRSRGAGKRASKSQGAKTGFKNRGTSRL
jgi:hypothetical protein